MSDETPDETPHSTSDTSDVAAGDAVPRDDHDGAGDGTAGGDTAVASTHPTPAMSDASPAPTSAPLRPGRAGAWLAVVSLLFALVVGVALGWGVGAATSGPDHPSHHARTHGHPHGHHKGGHHPGHHDGHHKGSRPGPNGHPDYGDPVPSPQPGSFAPGDAPAELGELFERIQRSGLLEGLTSDLDAQDLQALLDNLAGDRPGG